MRCRIRFGFWREKNRTGSRTRGRECGGGAERLEKENEDAFHFYPQKRERSRLPAFHPHQARPDHPACKYGCRATNETRGKLGLGHEIGKDLPYAYLLILSLSSSLR